MQTVCFAELFLKIISFQLPSKITVSHANEISKGLSVGLGKKESLNYLHHLSGRVKKEAGV